MKAAQDNSQFFLTRVKFLRHISEGTTMTPSKARKDSFFKLQLPSNEKRQEFLGMLNFLGKCVYELQ